MALSMENKHKFFNDVTVKFFSYLMFTKSSAFSRWFWAKLKCRNIKPKCCLLEDCNSSDFRSTSVLGKDLQSPLLCRRSWITLRPANKWQRPQESLSSRSSFELFCWFCRVSFSSTTAESDRTLTGPLVLLSYSWILKASGYVKISVGISVKELQ